MRILDFMAGAFELPLFGLPLVALVALRPATL